MTFTLIKLGGSVLTDRTRLFSFQEDLAIRLAREIRQSGRLPVIVHGTGTAGKAYARHYRRAGRVTADWLVFQLTTMAIRRLGDELGRVLRDEGVPHCLLPANALFRRRADGTLGCCAPDVVPHLLTCGVAPVLCGDVLVEERDRYGVISSDEIVPVLARELPVRSCVFVTDVDGVLTADGRLIEEVDEAGALPASESDRADITGGMSAKLGDATVAARAGANVVIINGRVPGRLRGALRGEAVVGTRVVAPDLALL
jgi:isopentenyl phosphate kinase